MFNTVKYIFDYLKYPTFERELRDVEDAKKRLRIVGY